MSKVFYSWQSFSPSTNRNFIEKALETAAKTLRRDETIEVEPVIDRDTKNTPGASDISDTIFNKIEQASVFLADVSIINYQEPNLFLDWLNKLKILPRINNRPIPNPNVLIETGFAIHALGMSKIILVMNGYFGEPDQLPFDLKTKRILTYRLPPGKADKTIERKTLEKSLEGALRDIYTAIDTILPDLTDADNAVFNLLCNAVVEREYDTFQQNAVFEIRKRFGDEEVFNESLRVLSTRKVIQGNWYANGQVYLIRVTAYGFDLYARQHINKYKSFVTSIVKKINEKNDIGSLELRDALQLPHYLVKFILVNLKNNGLIELLGHDEESHTIVGITKVSAALKRFKP